METTVRRGLRLVKTGEHAVEVPSFFDQVASIPVDTEIVHATSDGMRMVRTATGVIAMIDIGDVEAVPPPQLVPTSAVVTSVAITPDDHYVLVADSTAWQAWWI